MSHSPRKVLLVDPLIPGAGRTATIWAPLGLAYLAASLRQAGHQPIIHNRLARQLQERLDLAGLNRLLVELLRSEQPDIIGISGTTFSFADMRAVATLARQIRPEALIAIGGPHACAAPDDTLRLIPEAACLVVGEGEHLLLELARGARPADLPATVYRDEAGTIRRNPWQPPPGSLDDLPRPARDLMGLDWYVARSRRGIRATPVVTTTQLTARGCPHRCAFCSEPAYSVRGVRAHSPEYAVAEAEEILGHYRCDLIVFLDEMFTTDRERVMKLMDLWRARGLDRRVKFSAQARADSVDPEILAALKQAGCLHLELGAESGSDAMLQRMRKGTTAEQNRAAVRLVREAGIRVQTNVILGCPDETEDEALDTLRFLDEARPDVVALLKFVPLPNTAFTRQLVESGRLEPLYWALEDPEQLYPEHNFTAMSQQKCDEVFMALRRLADGINAASWRRAAPPWMRARRRLGNLLRQAGLLRPRRG